MRARSWLRLGASALLILVAIPGLVALAAPSRGQFVVRAPLLASDGPVPTPTRTPWPAMLPCDDILVPIDKQHELSPDCEPPDLVELPPWAAVGTQRLRVDAANALVELANAAAREGYALSTDSGYRSYATQESVFAMWVAVLGLEQAERTSARAGHSEHQLGTTVDLCGSTGCLDAFAGSSEAAWVAAHAWEYGWLVSYPDEKEGITGYAPEPWHIRFVGRQTAATVRASGLTLHEYLLR